MNQVTRIASIVATLVSFGLSVQSAQAATNSCADTTVLELGVDANGVPAQFDVALRIKRVDNGTALYVQARHFMHDHSGVQRIERLATSAFLANTKLHVCWEDGNNNITKVFLKK